MMADKVKNRMETKKNGKAENGFRLLDSIFSPRIILNPGRNTSFCLNRHNV